MDASVGICCDRGGRDCNRRNDTGNASVAEADVIATAIPPACCNRRPEFARGTRERAGNAEYSTAEKSAKCL